MPAFLKERLNPLELIKAWWPDADTSHITCTPDLTARDADYSIIRQVSSDGTSLFSIQMLQDVLLPIIQGVSYCKLTEPKDWSRVQRIKYEVGQVRLATVHGKIFLRCSSTMKYPGQRERARLPVKCEYIYHEEKNAN